MLSISRESDLIHFKTNLEERRAVRSESGSSGSIVSDYGLDDRAIGVRSQAGAKNFSSNLCVQTGSGAHPASCTIGTGGPFPGAKARPRRDADHSSPSSAEIENEYELYLVSPASAFVACSGTALAWSR
jgi:hypothetical protein